MEAEAPNQNDLSSLIMQAKFYGLMANIHERSNNLSAAMETLDQT